MTLVVPPAPAAPVVTAGDGLVTIQWSAPEFNPSTNRPVVGYVLTPYIGTTAQTPLNYPAAQTMPIYLSVDGDGNDIVNGTTYTFRVTAISSVGLGIASQPSVAVTPNPVAEVALSAEQWDYSTTRVQFTITQKMRDDLNAAIHPASGPSFSPRLAITRSGYGRPTTPLDGVKLLDLPYQPPVEAPDTLAVTTLPFEYHVNNTIPSGDEWVRPVSSENSIYDHNLQQGRWYYYTLFLFVAPGKWVSYASAQALVPVDYRHRDTLWAMVPEYYRTKDEEFLVYPETEGDLKHFINIIGFDLDYTRTLAEGVQDTYQVERANATLVQLLGESNLGTIKEEGLGEIRYRSLVSVLTRLYNERGTGQGIKNLSEVTSKFRTTTVGGTNLMRESDDSDFSTGFDEPVAISDPRPITALGNEWHPLGSGNWAPPYLTLLQGLVPHTYDMKVIRTQPFIGGLTYSQVRGGMTAAQYQVSLWPKPVDWPNSPSPKKRGGLLDLGKYANKNTGLVLACGAGIARTGDRYHNQVPRLTFPSIHGIRCTPGNYYDWSLYSEQAHGVGADPTILGHGTVSLGVFWFGAPKGVNADDLVEFPMVNDDVTRKMDLPGFKPIHQSLVIPPFEAMGYLSRDERVWTRDPSSPLLGSYAFPVTLDDETDSHGLVHDATVNGPNPKRYALRTIAPISNGPEDFVFAVPYLAFSDSRVARYIGCAMFSEESNPRNKYIITRRIDPVNDSVSEGTRYE